MTRPVRGFGSIVLEPGLLIEWFLQQDMQGFHLAEISLFCTFDGLLREIIAQDELRIDREHLPPTRFVCRIPGLEASLIILVPGSKSFAVDKQVAQLVTIFNRAKLTDQEVRTLRGIVVAIAEKKWRRDKES